MHLYWEEEFQRGMQSVTRFASPGPDLSRSGRNTKHCMLAFNTLGTCFLWSFIQICSVTSEETSKIWKFTPDRRRTDDVLLHVQYLAHLRGCRKHLLRYWPILARSSTLHFDGAVNIRQKITVHIINLVYSEFPNRSCRIVRSFIST